MISSNDPTWDPARKRLVDVNLLKIPFFVVFNIQSNGGIGNSRPFHPTNALEAEDFI
jgi:hypothetical protein